MDINAFGYFLAGVAGIASYLAFRSSFQLFKLGASVLWIAMFMWIKSYSPSGTEGNPFQVVALLGAIVMVTAFILASLGSEINKQTDVRSGLNTEASGRFSFKLPDWLKATIPGGSEKLSREKRARELEDYRDRLHRALNPPKRTRR